MPDHRTPGDRRPTHGPPASSRSDGASTGRSLYRSELERYLFAPGEGGTVRVLSNALRRALAGLRSTREPDAAWLRTNSP